MAKQSIWDAAKDIRIRETAERLLISIHENPKHELSHYREILKIDYRKANEAKQYLCGRGWLGSELCPKGKKVLLVVSVRAFTEVAKIQKSRTLT